MTGVTIHNEGNSNIMKGILGIAAILILVFTFGDSIGDTVAYRRGQNCDHNWKAIKENKTKRRYGPPLISIVYKCTKCGKTKEEPKHY